MNRDDALHRMHANLAAFIAWIGQAAPSSSTLRWPGLVASVVPSTQQRSIFNSVVYHDAGALLAVHAQLDQHYHNLGIAAWTVWLMPGEERVAEALQQRGHKFDGAPAAMAMDLRTTPLTAPAGLDYELTQDYPTIAAINQQAYGVPSPAFDAMLLQNSDPAARFYLARYQGIPACTVMTYDVNDDCGIYVVATLPNARGHGLATRLMTRALLDARARGCTTSTLQGSPMGTPVYQKMGYENLGAMSMWELRR